LRGYRHKLSVRQLELSDTRVFERPAQGRDWFELMLRDQLALGRPDHVQITFGRKITSRTPGRFRTRVINDGVEPQIQAHYKHSKVKQYFKEGRALRTETTINDPNDFGIGRTLTAANWQALTDTGQQINERLLSAQLAACDCAPDSTTLQQVVSPSTEDGLPAPALRFGDQRVMALLSSICSYRHLFAGLTNKSLRELVAGLIPGYTARQMTYDLRPPAPQGPHPPDPEKPALRADRPRPADRRLLHEDLHTHPQPVARRTRPRAPRRDHPTLAPRASMASVRASPRRPHRRRPTHSLKR
jgi:hypothetical protein